MEIYDKNKTFLVKIISTERVKGNVPYSFDTYEPG
jgi:hypothetical protein